MPDLTLPILEAQHMRSLLAPDVGKDMYDTLAKVWRAAEGDSAEG